MPPQQQQTTPQAPPSQQTLAQLVRGKYPGAYDDMDDATLEKNVLAKYPQYSDLPRTQAGPNFRTGEGVQAATQQQAKQVLTGTGEQGYYNAQGRKVSGPNGEPLSYMEKAEQDLSDRQTRLGAAENRAARSPTPFTNASMLYAPVTAAKALIGAKVGSTAGGYVGGQPGQAIGGLAGAFAGGVPWNRSTLGKAIINPETLEPRAGIKLLPWMNNERATALGNIIDPNLPKVRGMVQATEESMPNRIQELADQAKQQTLLGQENAAALRRMPQPGPPWETPAHQEFPLGSPEYPGPFSKIPNRVPASMRGDPFAPKPPLIATPPQAEAESGTLQDPRFSGSEGRAATWDDASVLRLAAKGNRDAISQVIRRQLPMPPGARYVMGEPDLSRAVLNPRETTSFEGQPIRNMENPNIPKSSKKRILPWEQSNPF